MTYDQQFKELTVRLNKAEAESRMLLAENKSLNNEVKGYQKRVCSMCDGHGLVGNCIDSMDCPDCTKAINNIKADAIDDFIELIISDDDKNSGFGDLLRLMQGKYNESTR